MCTFKPFGVIVAYTGSLSEEYVSCSDVFVFMLMFFGIEIYYKVCSSRPFKVPQNDNKNINFGFHKTRIKYIVQKCDYLGPEPFFLLIFVKT